MPIGEELYKKAINDQAAKLWTAAIPEYVELLKTNSAPAKTSTIYRALGQCYFMVGESNKSMTCYNRSLELDPGQASTFVNRAQLYWHQFHNYPQAIEDVNKAISLNPNFPQAIKFKNELDFVKTGVQ